MGVVHSAFGILKSQKPFDPNYLTATLDRLKQYLQDFIYYCKSSCPQTNSAILFAAPDSPRTDRKRSPICANFSG